MWLKWLYPGMRVKRWLILVAAGVLASSAGLALLAGLEILGAVERAVIRAAFALTGRLPEGIFEAAGVVLVLVGLVLLGIGIRQTIRSLVAVFAPGDLSRLAQVVYERRHLERGPRIVVIGGGTGLSALLRGLKAYTGNLTAVVTVADDGGSSGRLRSELGIPPPGDLRNTLVALAAAEPLMQRLFQYRFRDGDGLAGHSFGNLFIAAMANVTGDFEEAIQASSRVLAIQGQVVPSTVVDVVLKAEYEDGTQETGESRIPQVGKRIRRVWLEPKAPEPVADALHALESADAIVIGPGSLYTSLIPNLLVPGIGDAIRRSPAVKVFVCNVMTQPGETDGYTASDHAKAVLDHVGQGIISAVLMNDESVPSAGVRKYRSQGAVPITPDRAGIRRLGLRPYTGALISHTDLVRHDSGKLASALIELIQDEWGAPRTLVK